MIELNQFESINVFGEIAIIAILGVSIIHFIGFLNLEAWLNFSGIGDKADHMKSKYGIWSIILLNLAAGILFIIIPIVYVFAITTGYKEIAWFLVVVFILRGVTGIFAGVFLSVSTATRFWQVVFSTTSAIIGMLLYLGMEGI